MNKPERETGYYWVKYYERDDWTISYYSGFYDCWDNRGDCVSDNYFEEIDEKRIEREGAI